MSNSIHDYAKLAVDIIEAVGGEKNIAGEQDVQLD